METEDTNVHKKYLNIACIVLGIPAAILAAFEINYGKGFNEERDFSFRISRNGMRCVLIDNLYVYHKRHASFGNAERKKQLEANDRIFKERWGDLVAKEKDFTKHHNPIDGLRRQIQPEYFKKGLFYTKSVLPDKTVWRVFGIKITLKK